MLKNTGIQTGSWFSILKCPFPAPVNIFKAGADEESRDKACLVPFSVLVKIEEGFCLFYDFKTGSLCWSSLDFYSSLLHCAIAIGDLVKSTLGPKGMVRKTGNFSILLSF